MRPLKYKYTVYDILESKTLLTDGVPVEVEKVSGLYRGSISHYANIKPYKNRYLITSIETGHIPKTIPKKSTYIEKQLTERDRIIMREFDKVTKFLRENLSKEMLSKIRFKAVGT